MRSMMVRKSGSRFRLAGLLGIGTAGLGGGVDDGEVEDGVQVDVGVLVGEIGRQGQEQVGGLGDDLADARVGTVHLVDDEDDRQIGGERLAQHEAGLGKRPLRGVHEQDDAVDHGQAALDLTAEIGVPGSIDDVDGDALGEPGVDGGRTAVVNGGVLGEDGDALLALELAGVHDALARVLLGRAGAEGPGLPQHRVDKSRLAVVDVGDDGDVAQILAHSHMEYFFRPRSAGARTGHGARR